MHTTDACEPLTATLEANERHYSDTGFWNKIRHSAGKASSRTLEPALKMYYSAQDPSTPRWAKATIYGALGYFISPIDAIPDLTPCSATPTTWACWPARLPSWPCISTTRTGRRPGPRWPGGSAKRAAPRRRSNAKERPPGNANSRS
ncbi:YkvA family protein [Halomonas sp. E19]|uniref:YkvA family protein n=1 Tax=Halomonas sp. E19 TaxID=3397247 RepID=UPI004033917B